MKLPQIPIRRPVMPGGPTLRIGRATVTNVTPRSRVTSERPPPPTLGQTAQTFVDQYERAEMELAQLMALHSDVFEKHAELEAVKNESREALKRIFFTKEGPPAEVAGKKSHVWVRTDWFEVEVQYKQKADYYDPSELPSNYLLIPGVVTEVSTEKLDAVLPHNEVLAFKRKGAYMAPVVLVNRRRKGDQP